MDITGIIAEYNPFHSGHEHHIARTREAFPGTGIVCVMSGNLVQRGDFAIAHKNVRARAAISAGADLVFELPCAHAMASAPVFARGAVFLLASTGMVNRISFGSECGDAELLKSAALHSFTPEFKAELHRRAALGQSYAAACGGAYPEELAGVCQSPNNLLGIEYIRAALDLCPDMDFFSVPRVGSAHDGHDDPALPSASAIRSQIISGKEPSLGAMPRYSAELLAIEGQNGRFPVSARPLELAVLAALKRLSPRELADIPEVTEGLENRFFAACKTAGSLSSLLSALKTKRYTMARLRRVAYSSLVGLTRSHQLTPPPYLRLLAAGKNGPELLSAISAKATLPLIIKPASLKKAIQGADPSAAGAIAAAAALEERVDSIYALAYPDPDARGAGGFYTISPYIDKS